MKNVRTRLAVMILLACMVVPFPAGAEDQPRDFLPAPPGTILSLLYYNHLTGDSLYADGHNIADVDFKANIGIFRFVYYFAVGPFTADVNVLIPFGDKEFDVGGTSLSASGSGNPTLVSALWLLNNARSKSYVSVAQYIFLPVGSYSNHGSLSVADNWWRFRTELNYTQGFEIIPNHNLYAEVTVGGDFVTDNTDYLAKSTTLSEEPTFNLESHLSYDLTKDWWLAADFYGHWGGAQSYDTYDGLNRVNSQSVGGTLGYNLTSNWSVLFSYKSDVYVENGVAAQSFLVRLAYATNLDQLRH